MYAEFFGLKELPFRTSPDARFLYLSDQVNEALQKCLYMIENAVGPLYVYGPIGTGKTTLSQRLVQQLAEHGDRYVLASLIVPPQLRVNGFLRAIMAEFEVKTARSYSGSLENFAAWLHDQYLAGRKPVLILDEAQNLSPSNLKLLHFLLNYETNREKLLQLVLFGQNQLAERIERFPELKSRMYPAALTAFNRRDTEQMIAFRWMVAGGTDVPFPGEVMDDIFRYTLGLPREIVKVCDLALLRAVSASRNAATEEDIALAAQELRLAKE